ncbi:sulfite exporter TauE/SafE family protein [Azospirillum sp. RWY-5-1]|uniref:Probable membrane transporter protein n=1 Tax=Azospirillum oleiclasticum TaxID=2735135 RepID=A0ABX2TJR4_9PROT|nr:sulfite exporter TauE/SafE family protein [Azospirillum oleiclasticum]NYZ16565.1 sulfite exporter TauE/SafE family protein [Azospirillum oleiclasticum]NYZ23965.1 sulfite exporter TauE/SafE family protein [Azospirillum oleiclasticum]
MITDPVFYLAAIPAVILVGLAKGGLSGIGMLAMPLLAMAVDPVQAAAIMLPILIIQDAVAVWSYRRSWDRRNLAILIPSATVGIVVGYLLAARVSATVVEVIIGVISIVFGLRRLVVERGPTPATTERGGTAAGWFWGIVSGFTSMIAHAGGPPFQVYVMPQRLPRDVFIGTGVVFFTAVNWIKVPAYAALGQFGSEAMLTAAVLMPLAVLSTRAGVYLVRRIDGKSFYTVIYALLVALGVKLLWDGARVLL